MSRDDTDIQPFFEYEISKEFMRLKEALKSCSHCIKSYVFLNNR